MGPRSRARLRRTGPAAHQPSGAPAAHPACGRSKPPRQQVLQVRPGDRQPDGGAHRGGSARSPILGAGDRHRDPAWWRTCAAGWCRASSPPRGGRATTRHDLLDLREQVAGDQHRGALGGELGAPATRGCPNRWSALSTSSVACEASRRRVAGRGGGPDLVEGGAGARAAVRRSAASSSGHPPSRYGSSADRDAGDACGTNPQPGADPGQRNIRMWLSRTARHVTTRSTRLAAKRRGRCTGAHGLRPGVVREHAAGCPAGR